MFTIFFTKNAEKEIKEFEEITRKRILRKISDLQNFPQSILDIKKMVGPKNAFRLRVGTYRILFSVHWEEKEILVYEINTRERAYK